MAKLLELKTTGFARHIADFVVGSIIADLARADNYGKRRRLFLALKIIAQGVRTRAIQPCVEVHIAANVGGKPRAIGFPKRVDPGVAVLAPDLGVLVS